MIDGYVMTETSEFDEEKLTKEVDAVFDRIEDITYHTSNAAKNIILKSAKLGITPEEFLEIVGSYLSDFKKAKEGKNNEKI